MNPETGEPTDDLLPQAIDMIAALGSRCTKVTEVVQQRDQAVYTAIQKGLDQVNEHAETTVHTVSTLSVCITCVSVHTHKHLCFVLHLKFGLQKLVFPSPTT